MDKQTNTVDQTIILVALIKEREESLGLGGTNHVDARHLNMNGNLHATTRNVNGLSTISSKKLFYQLTLAILVDRIEHAHDLIDKNNDTLWACINASGVKSDTIILLSLILDAPWPKAEVELPFSF